MNSGNGDIENWRLSYIKVLEFGPDESEQERKIACQMIEKKYAYGHCEQGGDGPELEIILLTWEGLTPKGRDYLEHLRARADSDKPQPVHDQNSNSEANKNFNALPPGKTVWSWVRIAEATIAGVLVLIVVYLLYVHFGINLKY